MKVRRILIIHADNVIKEMLLLCLETIPSCEAIAVTSGLEGMEKAPEADAILLDIDETIPDISWQEIVQSLQQNPLTRLIPIILLTATLRSQELIEFQRQEDIRAIAKSFDLMTTADRVAVLLEWN